MQRLTDKIVINKYALTIGTVNGYYFLDGISDMMSKNQASGFLLTTLGTLGLYISKKIAERQNRDYDRLSESLNNKFDERLIAPFMEYPCGRSIVKTILKRMDKFELYPKLSKAYPLKRYI